MNWWSRFPATNQQEDVTHDSARMSHGQKPIAAQQSERTFSKISMIRLSTRVHPNRAAKPPCLDGPHLKNLKPLQLSVENH
jgi:hypothetical protein